VAPPSAAARPARVARLADQLAAHGLTDSTCVVFNPTLLQLAGVPVPEDPLAAGRSLLPRLTGAAGDPEHVVVFDEYGGTRMVRTADWKLVRRYGAAPDELYHLTEDPAERHDRIADATCRAVVDELTGVLVDRFARHADAERDAFDKPVSGRGAAVPGVAGRPEHETYDRGAAEIRSAG